MEIGVILGSLLIHMPILLAYLAGVIVTLLLANRQHTSAAYLALIGFALLLFFESLASLTSLAPFWFANMGIPVGRVSTLVGLIALALNLGSTAGIVCLILALWRGLRPPI
jgi:hypothetical protein